MEKMNKTQVYKVRKALRLVRHEGYNWQQAAKAVNYAESTLMRLLNTYFETRKKTLKELKQDVKSREALKKLETLENSPEEEEEVILVEMGYILSKGADAVLQESLPIFIPGFCVNELNNIAYRMPQARSFLSNFYALNRFETISSNSDLELFVEPEYEMKLRSKSIVAAACYLWTYVAPHVRILTNSYEVAELAKAQGCDFTVIKV